MEFSDVKFAQALVDVNREVEEYPGLTAQDKIAGFLNSKAYNAEEVQRLVKIFAVEGLDLNSLQAISFNAGFVMGILVALKLQEED